MSTDVSQFLPDLSNIPARRRIQAFTLVELLVAMVVLVVISLIVIQITDQTSKIWRGSTARIQAFQEARAGFESMTRKLSQATLNTYYDYYDSNSKSRLQTTGSTALANFIPETYDRMSDLHFISGQANTLLKSSTSIITQTHAVFFQAPLGYSAAFPQLDNALNACGYFLQFSDAADSLPPHIRTSPSYRARYRYRLMEMTQRTELLGIYDPTAVADSTKQNDWFVLNAAKSSRVIAENIIALVILPALPTRDDAAGSALAPNFNYNSRIPLNASSDAAWSGAVPPFPGDKFVAQSASGPALDMTRHHQLPPLVRVLMIGIDETSAARIQGSATTVPAGIDFSKTSLFTVAANLEKDLQDVKAICEAKPGNLTGNTVRLTYRVFNTEIIMPEAKWSNK